MLDTLMASDWVVYAKPCLGHAERVVAYLARYTHRTALSDRRLVDVDGERIALRYIDRRDDNREKLLWLEATELIRRFLLHVLPKGLMRIRHYGLLANRWRAVRVRQIRAAIAAAGDIDVSPDAGARSAASAIPSTSSAIRHCPRCRIGELTLRLLTPQPPLDGG